VLVESDFAQYIGGQYLISVSSPYIASYFDVPIERCENMLYYIVLLNVALIPFSGYATPKIHPKL
jgi:hypothetical protein